MSRDSKAPRNRTVTEKQQSYEGVHLPLLEA